jgi:hypothetical protein
VASVGRGADGQEFGSRSGDVWERVPVNSRLRHPIRGLVSGWLVWALAAGALGFGMGLLELAVTVGVSIAVGALVAGWRPGELGHRKRQASATRSA